MVKGRIHKDLKTKGKCRLFIAKEQLFSNLCAFATAKLDPMAKILSDECVLVLIKYI